MDSADRVDNSAGLPKDDNPEKVQGTYQDNTQLNDA